VVERKRRRLRIFIEVNTKPASCRLAAGFKSSKMGFEPPHSTMCRPDETQSGHGAPCEKKHRNNRDLSWTGSRLPGGAVTDENTTFAQPVSLPRVLLGGLRAGTMIDSIQYLSDAVVYVHKWEAAASLFGRVAAGAAPAAQPLAISPRLILFLLQAVGLAAGILAVRFGCRRARSRKAYLLLAATGAWTLTFGFLSAVLVWLLKGAADSSPASSGATLSAAAILAFAVSTWTGVLAGAAFGCWIYRESEAASGKVVNV
jgi:hypothetical protein